jgi:tetratricopeptide (TPR) repeat protein
MATSQYSDACEAYNRSVNLNPNVAKVWCSLGVLYYAFGQYREALGMLARALKLDSTMADAWYNVGALYDMCDQAEDANLAYAKAKENGLAERFAKAGMGSAPLAMQPLQPQPNTITNGQFRSQYELGLQQQQQQLQRQQQQQQLADMIRLQQEQYINHNPNSNPNNLNINNNIVNCNNEPMYATSNMDDNEQYDSSLANDVDILLSEAHMQSLVNDGHGITDDDMLDDDDDDDAQNY